MTPVAYSPRGEAEVELAGGRTMLVWQGIPGETSRVFVEHEGQHQTYARWEAANATDPRRTTPLCDKYTPCGGCPWMHLTPAGQQEARTAIVRAALDQAGIDAPITAFHASPDGNVGFRHVIKVAIGESERGHVKLGAWGRNHRHIVPIPECPVAAPVLRKVMDALAYHVIDMDLRPFDQERGTGILRVAVLRASRTTGEVLITLVASKWIRELTELAERVATQVTNVVGVWLHTNDGPGNAIFARDGDGVVGVRSLLGKDHIEEKLGGLTYAIGPGDFFQTNPGMAEVLYARGIARAALAPGVPFLDLYCGVGGFALPAAKVAGWAMGVEEIEGAVHRARDAARKNGLNAEFVSGPAIVVLSEIKKRMAEVRPVVCVDPARRGLEEGVIPAILELRPRRIVYVSCNARAMARDLVQFREAGFTIGDVELFDMFPHAAHVEALVALDAPDAAEATRRAPRRKVVGRTSTH